VVIPPEAAIAQFRSGAARRLYANSENAINWIAHNLPFTDLPRQIQRLKAKAAFRRLLEPLFPDFYYRAVEIGALAAIDPATLPLPCIIKPAIGFFSMGVRKVSRPEEWPGVVRAIQAEMAAVQALYPAEVLDTTQFLIEECIEGEDWRLTSTSTRPGSRSSSISCTTFFPPIPMSATGFTSPPNRSSCATASG
jgi:hypothetical protein